MSKTKSFNTYSVVELSQNQLRNANGGSWPAIAAVVIYALSTDWDKNIDDFKRGWNS